MMVSTRRHRTREIPGPAPHEFALIARNPNKQPADKLILDRRREEEQRQLAEANTQYQKRCDLKNDWERWTDKKIQNNTVRRRVNDLLKANEFNLEDRRERLRKLLAAEDAQYLNEMEDKEETVIERQAKMRDRARQLREDREKERLSIVQTKLDQQWRNQCEELRGTISKRHQDEIAAERFEQLKTKAQIAKDREQEEQYFADLWYADIAAKAKREEEDTRRQMGANKATADILHQQMAALEAQKEAEKLLVIEEANLLKEQAALRKMEEQQALEERRIKQRETRELHDRNLRMKMQKQAKEMQEQLAFDMKILEQLLEESKNEAREQAQRKRELREEDRRYREYLRQLKEEERLHEIALEKLCDEEVEKTWKKRVAQWKMEKDARKKLLMDVVAARKQQIELRLRENELRQQEAQREREELVFKIAENKRLELEQQEKVHRKNKGHQNDIIGQIDYNRRLRSAEEDEERRLWQKEMEAEREYRIKLEEALANPVMEHMHPMRRPRQTKSMGDLLG